MEKQSFGYWLKLKRKALDLTREGLAERVGCSAATIQKLEEEERRPSAQIIERLAEIFDIPQSEQPAFLRFARGNLQSAPADLKDQFPWQESNQSPRLNLPATVTSLIGREKEIAEIREYLSKAEIRLVTLIGPPGIGKTRLSIESARSALPNFPDGVFFVALAPLSDPSLIPQAIAGSLGYVQASNVPIEEQLKEGIGDKRMLIVLDNCEHLIEAAATLSSHLLSACGALKILATSRESFRIGGEWLYPVPPFDIPEETSSITLERASSFPALTLFAERARAVQPDFMINSENIKIVTEICAHLDGLPLVIELIAARMRLMSPEALLQRLSDQFILTADGMRAASERQKTLSNAIEWSYNLLSVEEQKLFAYLSVFSDGFTLENAESIFSQIIKGKPISNLVTSLLDKSLLQRVSSRGASTEPCYTMLVTIQEFARERLQAIGEEREMRNRHLAYFLDVAQKADQELRGPNQLEWLERLNVMYDNLRVALDWAIETGQTETALQLAHRLWWFWSKRSDFNEAREWLGRVLAMPDAQLFSDSYADVLTQLAHHTCLQIGPKEAKPLMERALAFARLNSNPSTLANTLLVFGIVLAYEAYEENFAVAQPALEESMALFLKVQDQWGYALAMMSLGYSAYKKEDEATALTLSEQALTAFRELGDQYFQSSCLYQVGNLRAKQGDWQSGLADLRESLTLSRRLGSKYEIAGGLWRLADTEQHLGRPARAVRLYCAARNVSNSIGAWHHQDDSKLEKHLASCRAALSESEIAAAVEQGRAMTAEQAIAYALEYSDE